MGEEMNKRANCLSVKLRVTSQAESFLWLLFSYAAVYMIQSHLVWLLGILKILILFSEFWHNTFRQACSTCVLLKYFEWYLRKQTQKII